MAIDPGTTTPIFEASLFDMGFIGMGTPKLAQGLANGLFQYLTQSITVSSIDVGTFGVGTGNGIGVILPDNIIFNVLNPCFLAFQVFGPLTTNLAQAISLGLMISLAGAEIQTNNPLVGIGIGKLQLLPSGTGGHTFIQAFKDAGMNGSRADDMGSAIGTSLDILISVALGVIVILGPPNILPGAGVGSGTLK